MKNIFFLFFLFPLLIFASDSDSKPSTIKKVTVYLNGASIERAASINLLSGENTVVFNDLSPDINENSIQISGLKNATVLSLGYAIDYLEKGKLSEDFKLLETKLDNLKKHKNEIQNSISGYQKELELLEKNQRINSDATDLSLVKVKEMSTYYRTRVTEIKNTIYNQNLTLSEVNKDIQDYSNELYKLEDDRKKRRGKITVKLDAKQTTNLSLIIKYNINNAGWFPVYDIKAKNTNSPIEISYKASVYQQSGTDWEDVAITLSTGDPNTNNLKPELSTKYLNFVNRQYRSQTPISRSNHKYNPTVKRVSGTVLDNTGLPLPGVNVIVKGTSHGTQTDFDGNYTLEIRDGEKLVYSYVGFETINLPVYASIMNVQLPQGETLEEVVVTGYGGRAKRRNDNDLNRAVQAMEEPVPSFTKETGITNTQFKIKKSYSIPSSTEVTSIEIETIDLPATYQHYAAPELNENVFLTAIIKNYEQYDFLPGEANVYFEGNYAGKSIINPQVATDSLNLSLGTDPNVIVTREKLKNYKSKSFLGGNRIIEKGFKIEIKNNKNTTINLLLEDRIPISQNEKIKLDDISIGAAKYNKETGILKWNLTLSANKKDEKEFSYTVKYPKDKRINLN
ncbi:mucoidy inhibitor MuiA family protein [uncultured Marixanthomonas sp.]|uniref:mucoidy inhibitor MuiA family protein n=1 Tax=uncultured Marixanthomonas sp. TaxID=757245 RepID=UPI0030D8542A|tara:strand:+ start:45764 stop:47632 length:1869 start_codon:yes stop_codon:yes gene_type:complete